MCRQRGVALVRDSPGYDKAYPVDPGRSHWCSGRASTKPVHSKALLS